MTNAPQRQKQEMLEELPESYGELLGEIKQEIAAARTRVTLTDGVELLRPPEDRAGQEFEDALADKLIDFFLGLGVGFAFAGRQYRFQVGEQECFIDLLFYHLELRCYVVVELKAGSAGELGFWVEAVDELIRDETRDVRTLGILIAVVRDEPVVHYALRSSCQPLTLCDYESFSDEVKGLLPGTQDLSRIVRETLAARAAQGS